MEIFQLSQRLEYLDTVGNWIYDQWWRTADNSPEVVTSQLRCHTVLDTVPFTLIAVDGDEVVGSCCVIENDCSLRPQYRPWVAAVFVREDKRRLGIASQLLSEAVSVSEKSGIEELFLLCEASKVSLYERCGWLILETNVGENQSVIMHRHTNNSAKYDEK